MTSKGESPRERQAHAHATPTPTPTPTLKTFKICKRTHAIFNNSSILAMLQDGTDNWQRGHALRKHYHRGQLRGPRHLPTSVQQPTRPVSLPPASCQPQDAIRTDAASAESLEAHDATEKQTKKPKHQEAHDEHALTHHTLASKEQLTRPANWDSMTRTARKHWKTKQAKYKKILHK